MSKQILITGGAGFVGSHLADELLQHGYKVRVLDNLCPQVHAGSPQLLPSDVELIQGDVRDAAALEKALRGVDAVYHLAAVVGVGQSMYQIENYTSVNGIGTAALLEQLAKHPVEKLIVASSMSIYGEGMYRNSRGKCVEGHERSLEQLRNREWELRTSDGKVLEPIATPESKRPALPSVYAISKYHQERLCMTTAAAYGITPVALRFFNIYGPRQALSNPYTGVLAIFASRLLNGQPPLINEDGRQRRDFVNVRDVARACRLAYELPNSGHGVYNVGSGSSYSIREVAELLAQALDRFDIEPEVTGRYRVGDIRNCFADITAAKRDLGFSAEVPFLQGLQELAEWLEGQTSEDHAEEATRELAARGLLV